MSRSTMNRSSISRSSMSRSSMSRSSMNRRFRGFRWCRSYRAIGRILEDGFEQSAMRARETVSDCLIMPTGIQLTRSNPSEPCGPRATARDT